MRIQMIKKFLHNSLLPFAIFVAGLALIGCEPDSSITQQDTVFKTENEQASSDLSLTKTTANILNIVQDVAVFESASRHYLTQIEYSQNAISSAIKTENPQQLHIALTTLKQELQNFNHAMQQINVKSWEVDQVRHNIISNNQDILTSDVLRQNTEISKIDLHAFQQHIQQIQNHVSKLAALAIAANQQRS